MLLQNARSPIIADDPPSKNEKPESPSLLKWIVPYMLGFAVINNVFPQTPVFILAVYMFMFMTAYALKERMLSSVLIIPCFIVAPFIFFHFIRYFVDSAGYEFLYDMGYKDLLLHYFDAMRGDESTWFLRGAFILLTYPFLNNGVPYQEFGYVPYNIFSISICSILLHQLAIRFVQNHDLSERFYIIPSLAFALFLLSPSFACYSSSLIKDQTSLLFVLASTLFFIDRRYVLFALAFLAAYAVRSYNPLVIMLYILAFRQAEKYDYFYYMGLAGLLLIIIKLNPVALVNMIGATIYSYMNPLPIRAGNWQFPIFLITIQGLVYSLGYFHGMLQILSNKFREIGVDRIAISIMLFGCIIIAVGYNYIANLSEESYSSLGVGGDESLRKVLPILPLVCVQMSFVFVSVFDKIFPKTLLNSQFTKNLIKEEETKDA